jgi:hypothetical protein
VKTGLEQAREIVLRGAPARVYLFGSRARHDQARSSDIDVAILPLAPLPPGLLSSIREELEESNIPYVVDLVDLSQSGAAFREAVLREGVEWTG